MERWKKFCVEIDGVNCNNICPLGTGNSGFFCVPGGIVLQSPVGTGNDGFLCVPGGVKSIFI